jgi:hypothetical protein
MSTVTTLRYSRIARLPPETGGRDWKFGTSARVTHELFRRDAEDGRLRLEEDTLRAADGVGALERDVALVAEAEADDPERHFSFSRSGA